MPELIPHIQQYAGVWSIEPDAARRFEQMLKAIRWESHIREAQSRIDEGDHGHSQNGYEVAAGGVAVIDLEGVMTKYGSSLSMGGSTVRLRKALRNAREDPSVKSVMLCIESPGGATMGTPEAAEEVAATARVKPVTAFFEDIGASAAYWVGSQGSRVVANASAIVGSIGTYLAIDDLSAAFTEEGIKTHLFTTGPHKGAGYVGTELSKAQIAEFQSLVERMNAPFVAAVQAARDLDDEQLAAVTDGRVWRGDEAVAVGLIDAVMTYDEALDELTSNATATETPKGANTMAKPRATSSLKSETLHAKSEEDGKKPQSAEEEEEEAASEEDEEEAPKAKKKSKSKAMDEEKEPESEEDEEKPASIRQLKAALPKADSDFIVKALESGMSVQTARMAWMEQTIASQAEKIKDMESNAPKPGAKPLGSGVSSKSFDGADPIAAWKSAVKDAGSVSKAVAENPELHAAYIEARNAKRS